MSAETMVDDDLATSPAPRRRPGGLLAFATLTALGIAALSGVALSFHYVPSTALAHASLRSLEQEVEHGALLRSLHWLSSNTALALLVVVLLGAFLRADWRARGRVAWWTGVGVFLVTTAFGITGELLPWSEQAVFATEVRTGLLANSPAIGPALHTAVLGADTIAGPALTRFHALHVGLLPLLLIGLVWWHARSRGARLGYGHGLVGLLLAAGIGYGATQFRAPLGEVYVAGDTGFEPFPEWNFLWLNELLRRFPAELELIPAFIVPGVLVLVLLLLPFLHREPTGRLLRPLLLIPGVLVIIALGLLSWLNWQERPVRSPTLPYDLDWNDAERAGYASVRRNDCLECHAVEWGGVRYAQLSADPDAGPDAAAVDRTTDNPLLEDSGEFLDVDELADYLRMPETEDMPPYDFLPLEERRQIALFLKRLPKSVR